MNGKPDVLSVMITAASIADRLGYADFEEKCNRARATVERLAEAAQFVLDKEWEYGEEQIAFARLNAVLSEFRGEA